MPSDSPTAVPFRGIWPALLTPLDEELNVDVDAFAAHARALLDAGCTGVTPFGTTGEGPSFSVDERRTALEGLVRGGVPGERILVSTSCAALPDVVALTRHALQIGAHGCLMLPPFFLQGVSDQGVIDAYRWVIEAVADARLRLYLYHIPQVSGVPLSHGVITTLKKLYPQTIVGIKDSGANRATSLAFAEAFIDRVMVYVGNEPDLQTLAARGSVGAISGVGNVMPRLVQRLVSGFAASGAARDQERVLALIDILGGYGLTAAFKGVMAAQTGLHGWLRVRPPLVPLSGSEYERLQAQIGTFGIDRNKD
jgi:4-hydroxy-tetrahydrodipicolinate synthase